MLILIIIFVLILALDIVAWNWSVDSTEKIDSYEWERRQWRNVGRDGFFSF